MNRFITNVIFHKATLTFLICIFIPSIWTFGFAETELIVNSETQVFWFWKLLGRLHPLIVHFPVSLLLIAALMELSTLKNFNSSLRPGIYLLIIIGAISAVLSVIFGWLLAELESYGGDTLAFHRWTGLATAILSMFTVFFIFLIKKRPQNKWIKSYRSVLMFTVGGVIIAGHLGASITHGEEFLSSVTPWAEQDEESLPFGTVKIDLASFSQGTDSLTLDEEVKLNLGVRTILAHNCYKCHSADKTEGELRFDEKELVFQGGESGQIIVPGDVNKSELFRRITLPAGHKEAMPGKGKPLSKQDIDLIAFWIEKGAPWPDQAATGIFPVAALEPRMPILPSSTNNLTNPIDLWVNEYFKKTNTTWDTIVDDRTYLRRIYLDIVGLLPSPQELQDFIADTNADKRSLMVEQLLSQNNDYATHWLTFWNDLLRNDYTGTGYITNGRYSISDWLYQSLANNKPYKQFVKELLDPNDASKGFIKGIQWRGVVNSSQSVPMQAAQNVSQALLGLNLKCASCHDSFISDWKLDDAYAFANVFSEEPLEINRCDIPTGKFADTRLLWNQLGTISNNSSVKDKSEQLAENITKDENGRLYRTVVNRIWAQLLGRGIVAPVDEMDNSPWSQDLLDWLASDFAKNGYDVKKLIYLITTSKTYQLPAVGIADANKINAADYQFTGMLRRKMTAEQFSDAVSSTIHPIYKTNTLKYNPYGHTDLYKIYIPFARAALVENDDFLAAMGRPSRENVISVRENQSNLLQAMELTNGKVLNETLNKGAKQWLAKHNGSNEIITDIYLKALGRKPTSKEHKIAKEMLGETPKEDVVQDFLWTIVLLPEFQLIN